MPFKIKATHGPTTRKFPVSGTAYPSYAQLVAKIRSIFALPAAAPVRLTKLVWSPHNVGSVLVALAVESEDDWRRVTRGDVMRASTDGSGLPDGTLRFGCAVGEQPQRTAEDDATSTPTPTAATLTPAPATTTTAVDPQTSQSLASTLAASRETLAALSQLAAVPTASPSPALTAGATAAHPGAFTPDLTRSASPSPGAPNHQRDAPPLVVLPATETLSALRSTLAAHHLALEDGVKSAHADLKAFFSAFLENYARETAGGAGDETPKVDEDDKEEGVVPGAFGAKAPAVVEQPAPVQAEEPTPVVTAAAVDDAEAVPAHAVWPSEGKPGELVGVWCDGCGKRVGGVRAKCTSRDNYDLCLPCFQAVDDPAYQGQAFDKYLKFRLVLHPALMARVDQPHAHGHGRGHAHPHSHHGHQQQQQQQAPQQQAERHPASCDLCEGRIVGVRLKCLTCPDYDVCAACAPSVPSLHPHHAFVRLASSGPAAFFPSANPSTRTKAVHSTIVCDGCGETPVGPRFKCAVCADFDLCERCEALPVAVHDEAHPMIKLRLPTKVDAAAWFGGDTTARAAAEAAAAATAAVAQAQATFHDRPVPAAPAPTPTPVPTATELAAAASAAAAVSNAAARAADDAGRTVVLSHLFAPAELAAEPLLGRLLADDVRASASDLGWVEAVGVCAAEPDGVVLVTFGLAHAAGRFAQAVNGSMFNGHRITAKLHDGKTVYKREPAAAAPEEPTAAAEVAQPEMAQRESTPLVATPTASTTATTTAAVAPFDDKVKAADPGLHVAFVADVTVTDGDVFPAGALFHKAWRLVNASSSPLPASSRLAFAGGDDFAVGRAVAVGAVKPGDEFEVRVEMKAPESAGRYIGFFRLAADGEQFGARVWADIVVSDPAVTSAASSSLGASSIIMPSPPSLRAGAPTATSTAAVSTAGTDADDGASIGATSERTYSVLSTASSSTTGHADADDDDDEGEVSDVESVPESELSAFDEVDDHDGADDDGQVRQAEDEFELVYDSPSEAESTEAE